jgi:hypothetical protein
MLSTAYLLTASPPNKETDTKTNKNIVTIFMLLFVLDLIVLIYSIYCLLSCNLPWYMVILLLVLIFCPAVGFFAQIGIIVYHSMKCKKAKFEFF